MDADKFTLTGRPSIASIARLARDGPARARRIPNLSSWTRFGNLRGVQDSPRGELNSAGSRVKMAGCLSGIHALGI